LDIVDPPSKPDQVVIETEIFPRHRDHPEEKFRTRLWIGKPHFDDGQWICEEYVENFFQRALRFQLAPFAQAVVPDYHP
jgi:hypothetical protein